ncbi:AMP-binding protein [Streptomyces sp. NPDC048417]|uniref:AMP-binding protein n=1 Tax=Streptomyces sp. NPDC048417 TaxID=3155387 RepID=UPI003428E869
MCAPGAIAVEHEDERLSCREVNLRANRLAHRLIHEGVGPDIPLGLCVPRSIDMVVSLIAILKAGGAYLRGRGRRRAARCWGCRPASGRPRGTP